MEVKTAEQVLQKWFKPYKQLGSLAQTNLSEAMKEYAAQFIDLAAKEAVAYNDLQDNAKVIKGSILKIKYQIK